MSEDRHDVIRPLGTGNFTEGVYLAQHRDLGRLVAVKLLRRDQLNDREALLDEAKNMAALDQHDNVVQVLDAGDWDADHVYISSEYCDGGSLEGICAPPNDPLDPAVACGHISAACRGLDHMHRIGLLHLDVRPANILLANGTAKLADFGLARWVTNATVPQVYAPHAAPEMLAAYDGSIASDQYAMAMTLTHLLTGGTGCVMPPMPVTEDAWKGYPHLDQLDLNVPVKLTRVIAKATKFQPGDRYANLELFKRAVDNAAPAVSFKIVDENGMASTDGIWEITWRETRGTWSVDVRRGGRRVGKLSGTGLTQKQATRLVHGVVTQLAKT